MALCVVGPVVPAVSEDCGTFALKVQEEEETSVTAAPPTRRHVRRATLHQVKKLRTGYTDQSVPQACRLHHSLMVGCLHCVVYKLQTAVLMSGMANCKFSLSLLVKCNIIPTYTDASFQQHKMHSYQFTAHALCY